MMEDFNTDQAHLPSGYAPPPQFESPPQLEGPPRAPQRLALEDRETSFQCFPGPSSCQSLPGPSSLIPLNRPGPAAVMTGSRYEAAMKKQSDEMRKVMEGKDEEGAIKLTGEDLKAYEKLEKMVASMHLEN